MDDDQKYEFLGFFTEDRNVTQVMNYRTIHKLTGHQYCDFLVAVGDPNAREKLFDMATAFRMSPCMPLMHPSVVTGFQVFLGKGTIVCPNTTLTTNVKIGYNVLVNIGVTIGHDTEIGSNSTISPGANISGGVRIGNNCYIGSNSVIKENVKIGNGAVIGMGAVVLKDVEPGDVVVGNPARRMRLTAVPPSA